MHNIVVLSLVLCLISLLLLWSSASNREHFTLDLVSYMDLETVDPQTLRQYDTSVDVTFDWGKLQDSCNAQPDLGKCSTYSIKTMNLAQFVEDVLKIRDDYATMKQKYESFVMAIAYNPANNGILYYTVEQPWNLKGNPFQSPDNRVKFSGGRLYVPTWKYARTDPGPLAMDPTCTDILNQWKNTDDVTIIRRLETDPCLSRENKIKLVGMVLISYLTMFQNNGYGFKGACSQFDGLLKNIKNPELVAIVSSINKVCSTPTQHEAAVPANCAQALTQWSEDPTTVTDSTGCLNARSQKDFLDRLTELLQIGSFIPVDFLDSFYLMVNKFYDSSRNPDVKSTLRTFAAAKDETPKWKKLMDSLFKNLIEPRTVSVNGKEVQDTGLQAAGYLDSTVKSGATVIVDIDFSRPYSFSTVITKAVQGHALEKFSMSYADPFDPDTYVDMDRILYGPEPGESVKINSLDNIVTQHIRLYPLEFNVMGLRLAFEGVPVTLDRCSHMISVCEHEKRLASAKSVADDNQKRYDRERVDRLALLGQVQELRSDITKVNQRPGSGTREDPPRQRCLPQVQMRQVGPQTGTQYILIDRKRVPPPAAPSFVPEECSA
ncbi:g663 [Coccomyxa elongata]